MILLTRKLYEKSIMENWNIIKNEHIYNKDNTFDTSKPRSFNSLKR